MRYLYSHSTLDPYVFALTELATGVLQRIELNLQPDHTLFIAPDTGLSRLSSNA
jgi:hypothetical protein